jgi:hypothetical protein
VFNGGMLFAARGVVGLILLGVWIFCIIDAITTPPEKIKHLPKGAWVLIVIILPDIGSLIWLIAGRDRSGTALSPTGYGRRTAPLPTNPDDDEEFQRFLRQRAEQQRKRAREADGKADEPPSSPSG